MSPASIHDVRTFSATLGLMVGVKLSSATHALERLTRAESSHTIYAGGSRTQALALKGNRTRHLTHWKGVSNVHLGI